MARDVMISPPVTISPHASVVAAARMMDRRHVRPLVVIGGDGRLAGIVTPSDLLKVYLRPDEEIRREVLYKIISEYLGCDPRRAKVTVAHGVVTLGGSVEKKSMVGLAVGMSRAVDGVVDVIDQLGYAVDDTPVRRSSRGPVRPGCCPGDQAERYGLPHRPALLLGQGRTSGHTPGISGHHRRPG
jgi:CBS-domain-containing membrane protein